MHHYQQNVAGKLAWVDGPNNPWRQVIIPLVWASPTIFYTVLSLSSEDLARRYDDNHRQRLELQDVSLRFRNNALSLLAAQIGSIRANQPLQFSNEIVSEARNALASTLILYNVELLGAEAIKWRMHLQGARVIHQWLEHSTSYPASFDNIDKFLLYEHYYSSVFAGLTTFGMVNAPTGDNLQNMGDIAVFGEFVRVIQLVTELERSKYVHGLVINPSEFPNIIGTVETAKDKMILYSQKSHFWNDQVQRDFQHLVFIFYHASLIYTHRALSEDPSTNEYIQVSRDSILDWINLLSDRSTFAHDLVWPLFILGTESKGRPELQNFVSREMEAVMKISGVLDRRKVLSFLQLYWSTDLQHSVTWIQFMREKVPENSMLIL
ncbi:hypothetical protein N7532_006633 [Penicillium argentinense]|uniref:Uncharacterized protein n=1 Tax=Penicillium argentinense TaxID=1131581 RepID=A0A9W9KC57_9EURO|nr:uncharacterized protein N7532_006633 [Penicillium argentinense]KAJ5099632.1 hypothetical protein N7532_006633 [Penicillium argentinense]